jgi:hypothetical protein
MEALGADAFLPAILQAWMAARKLPLALAKAVDIIMRERMAAQVAFVAARKCRPTVLQAPSAEIAPIVRIVDQDSLSMVLADNGESFSGSTFWGNCRVVTLLARHYREHLLPSITFLGQQIHVAEDVASPLSSGEGHTDAVVNTNKANSTCRIAAHKGQEDNIILFTLIRIYRDDVDLVACDIRPDFELFMD